MSDECKEQFDIRRLGFGLVERVVSKPGAIIEVRLIEIPAAVQLAISANLEKGRKAATQRTGLR
jgi:hypothetical protein